MNGAKSDLLVAGLSLIAWMFYPALLELTITTMDNINTPEAARLIVRFVPVLYVLGVGTFTAIWLGRPVEE